jgi:beta-lactamase class C
MSLILITAPNEIKPSGRFARSLIDGSPHRRRTGPRSPYCRRGVRTTADDMLRFVEANLDLMAIDKTMERAITATHTGYYRVRPMTQDLIWEQYRYPVDLADLLEDNAEKVSLEANPVVRIDPPSPPQDNVLIDKTGSTNGFGAYAAFIPAKKIGVVLLADKNYPIAARVTAAYEILIRLIGAAPANR